MAVTKNDAPFTYTGSWDITEYSPGLFYARFLTSGTVAPKLPFTCDAFLVGGGGGGGGGNTHVSGGGGDGGGTTRNVYNVNITSNISITIGNGGSSGSGVSGGNYSGKGGTGGSTTFGAYTASGGQGGNGNYTSSGSTAGIGGSGGSGGGAGGTISNRSSTAGDAGGSNGSAGSNAGAQSGGSGQGTSTRPFSGTPFSSMQFAGGGGGGGQGYNHNASDTYPVASPGSGGTGGGGRGGNGGAYSANGTNGTAGTANTGGGGGGAAGNGMYAPVTVGMNGGSGGSGIVIIRGVLNRAPTDPTHIAYSQPRAGQTLILSATSSTDPDGDPVSYVWEHRTDSGTYTVAGTTTDPQITATVPDSGETYQARVKAVDDKGAASGYCTGEALPIIYGTTGLRIYAGDESGSARIAARVYAGDGVARQVAKGYIGDANGVARPLSLI